MNFIELYAKQLGYDDYLITPASYLLTGANGVLTATVEMGVNSAFVATELVVNAISNSSSFVAAIRQLSVESRSQSYNTNSFEITSAVPLPTSVESSHKALINGVFTGKSTAKLLFDVTVTSAVSASINGFIITNNP